MAKVQVKPRPDGLGLRQVAILTFAAVLFYKAQRASCEESPTAKEIVSSTGPPSAICPDFCNLPPDTATRSKAPFHRWYFDSEEGTCKRFRWGGRGGNRNRFFKRARCEETCSKCSLMDRVDEKNDDTPKAEQDKATDTVCSLPIDEGHCSNDGSQSPKLPQLVWHFDSENEHCVPFIFYGCGGNGNRFLGKAECVETCN